LAQPPLTHKHEITENETPCDFKRQKQAKGIYSETMANKKRTHTNKQKPEEGLTESHVTSDEEPIKKPHNKCAKHSRDVDMEVVADESENQPEDVLVDSEEEGLILSSNEVCEWSGLYIED